MRGTSTRRCMESSGVGVVASQEWLCEFCGEAMLKEFYAHPDGVLSFMVFHSTLSDFVLDQYWPVKFCPNNAKRWIVAIRNGIYSFEETLNACTLHGA